MSTCSYVHQILTVFVALACPVALHAQWEPISVPTNDNLRQIVVLPGGNLAVLADQQILTSGDGVGSWMTMAIPDSVGMVLDLISGEDHLIALGANVSRLTDLVGCWDIVLRAEQADGPFQAYTGLFGSPVYCSDDVSSYRSTDGGNSFVKLEPPTSNSFPSPNLEMKTLVGGVGYAAGGRRSLNSSFASVSRTIDSGRTWERVYIGEREGYVSQLTAVDAVAVFDVCAVGSQSKLDASEPSGLVVFSRDSGRTWTESETTFEHPLVDVVFNSLGHVYCLDAYGRVYRSLDGGRLWTQLETPDTERHINCLAFGQEGYLYAGGERGYLIRTGVPTSVEELAVASAIKVYPNPAINTITIKTAEDVRFIAALHSLNGALVRESTTEIGTTTLDVSGLPGGTYIVVVTTRGATTAQRLVLR